MSGRSENRNALIAAAVILAGVSAALILLPKIVLWIGDFSPILATLVGILIVSSFFLIFWIRARYQRRRDAGKSDQG